LVGVAISSRYFGDGGTMVANPSESR
jgi:hypothetical protein